VAAFLVKPKRSARKPKVRNINFKDRETGWGAWTSASGSVKKNSKGQGLPGGDLGLTYECARGLGDLLHFGRKKRVNAN